MNFSCDHFKQFGLSKGERAPAVLLPHVAKQTLPTYFVLNAMATTAYHNQFIRDLDKKCTILFLYGGASYSSFLYTI